MNQDQVLLNLIEVGALKKNPGIGLIELQELLMKFQNNRIKRPIIYVILEGLKEDMQ